MAENTPRKTSLKHFQVSLHGNLGKGKQAAEKQNGPCCCYQHSSDTHSTHWANFTVFKQKCTWMAVGYNDRSEKDVSIENHRIIYLKTQSLISTSSTPNTWK